MKKNRHTMIPKLLCALLALILILAFAAPAFAQSGSGNSSGEAAEEMSEEELARRKEVYTIVAMVTLGFIIVGIREKRNGRRW